MLAEIIPSRVELGTQMKKLENKDIEIQMLLEAIYLKYGFDFRSYARASVKRRILHRLVNSGMENISAMQHRILNDADFFNTLLLDLSINFSEMFRDPSFYLALRKKVIPVLKTFPFIKIWNAGCSSGEEVYSTAILLKEEGLYKRSQIYATDFNDVILQKAKEGIFPVDRIKEYTTNYQKSGGKKSFADYYNAKYEYAAISQSLKKNIVFANHNLVTDGVFGEMNLIMCRNVLIYFNRELQNHVFQLFHSSMTRYGFLCLGSKEDLNFSNVRDSFENFDKKEKIYKKKL
jgi:chemotaxis protein methyltransferase CheR